MLGADHDNDVQEAILQPGHAVLSSELCAWYEEVDCGEHGEEGQVQRAQDGGGGEARAGGGGLCSGLFVFKEVFFGRETIVQFVGGGFGKFTRVWLRECRTY